MKIQKHNQTNLIIRSSLALALALAMWSPVQAQSTEPAEGKKMMEGKMMDCCQSTQKLKGKMEADLKTQVSELTAQISEMNLADEDKKLNLMAGIVTQMVAQQKTMNVRRAEMEKAMMLHLILHMQAGKESMAQCPMMEDMDDKSGDAHKEHQ